MSSRVDSKAHARAKAAELRAEQARAERRRRVTIAGGVVGLVLVLVLALVVAKLSGAGSSDDKASTPSGTASTGLLASLQSVPAGTFDTIGAGDASNPPKAIDAPALTEGGKPRILYVGAEYCPYCAAERWAMVLALSRFGQFSKLGTTHSSSTDVFPDTPSLSFHDSAYTSDVLAFDGVETQGNTKTADGYTPLDKLSAADEALVQKYDAPPYVSSQGGIPFIDIGGTLVSSGASFDPQLLAGKTQAQVAAALEDPKDPITTSIVGSANVITAAICRVTKDQPAAVCGSTGVKAGAAKIGG